MAVDGGEMMVPGAGKVAAAAGATVTESFIPAVQWPGTPQIK